MEGKPFSKKKTKPPLSPGRPDYSVNALNKRTEHKGRVGVAWKQPDGRISIKLNPYVVLAASEDLVISLFEFEYEDLPTASPEAVQAALDRTANADPIPF